jgi:hypothetical protein
MIIYRKAGLRILETWFDERVDGIPADIVRHFQYPAIVSGAQCRPFHTILVDLSRESDLVLAAMKRETRYEIRRAEEKDSLTHEMWISADADRLERFLSFHDTYAAREGLPKVRSRRLRHFLAAGALSLSAVRSDSEDAIVWHAYYKTHNRVRLLYSASRGREWPPTRRAMVGRANRYHHWRDMLDFKANGVRTYDFGGWYDGIANSKLLSVNKFKEGFGGQIVLDYNCFQGLTILGKTAAWLYARLRGQ